MSEPLDLEPIKARLAAAILDLWDDGSFSGVDLKPWARDIIVNAPTDLAALVAEVERLREACQALVNSHEELVRASQSVLHGGSVVELMRALGPEGGWRVA